ncbi:MAG: ATP-binding protein [Dethiobacteria bacterium]
MVTKKQDSGCCGFMTGEELMALRKKAEKLLVYHKLLEDKIFSSYLHLLERTAAALQGAEKDHNVAHEAYMRTFLLLAEKTEFYQAPCIGDPWQNHLLDLLIDDQNIFSEKAERAGINAIGSSLLEAVCCELSLLKQLLALNGSFFESFFSGMKGLEGIPDYSWQGLKGLPARGEDPLMNMKAELKAELFSLTDWSAAPQKLADYYSKVGTGIFAAYRAFRWVNDKGEGFLEGIPHPDPIRLEDLVGYERERAKVLKNTEQFLAGLPANNMLFYGERGTGKSSTVKALLNRYCGQGLRLVEIGKGDLKDFGKVLRLLRGRPHKFIIFIDDLSFEEQEIEYKELKAILEGSIERRPHNVLVYATSNRRHLIREYFRDQQEEGAVDGGELRYSDTVQEKLSLAERFGITVIFPTPSQAEYLNIVETLAKQGGIAIDKDELRRKALKWAVWQNGRSGRTARQFIDNLSGELQAAAGERERDSVE